MNNMLTVEEVKGFLDISQDELEKYLKQGKIHAYKIGGTYLRFRKEDVLNLRADLHPQKSKKPSNPFLSRVADFWRFNNFYIISILVVIVLIVIAIKG